MRVMDKLETKIDPRGPVAALQAAEMGCWFDATERKHSPTTWTYRTPYLPTTALAQIAWLIENGWGVKIASRGHDTLIIKVWRHRA